MRRPHAPLLVAIALLALALPGHAVSAAGGPRIIAGHHDGAIVIGNPPLTEIVALPLTAGRWLLFAKATVVQGQDDVVNCAFDSQFSDDQASSVATDVGNRQVAWAGFLNLAAPADAVLRCQAFGGATGTEISRIRIIAIRVGKLTFKQFDADPLVTFGSGKPLARVRHEDDTAAIPNSSLGAVTSLSLPAGRWLAIYKGFISDASGGTPPAIECRFEIGNNHIGFRGDRALDEFANGDAGAMAMLQARRIQSKGAARTRCQATDVAFAGFQRILAIEAGTLVTGTLGKKFTSSGSGNPVIRFGTRAGPIDVPAGTTFVNLGRLPLPPGKWAIIATAYARNQTGGGSAALDCELTAGPDFDRLIDVEITGAAPHRQAPIVLAVVDSFSGKGTARFSCRSGGEPLKAYSVRIVAIRASTLSDQGL